MSPIPAPNLPNIYLTRIDSVMGGRECANVIALNDQSGLGSAAGMADALEQSLNTVLLSGAGLSYQNAVSDQKTFTNLHVVKYDADDPEVADNSLSGSEYTGNNNTHLLPPQTALCVTLRTNLAGRRNRGRLFDYGFCEDSNDDDGRCSQGTAETVRAFWEAVGLELAGTYDVDWVVLSRGWINEGGSDPRQSYAQSFHLISSWVMRDLNWDTIRSRVE